MDPTMGKAPIAILTTVLAVAVAALAMAPTPALAGSRARNVAATSAYIQADYALVHTARTNMKTGEAALEELRSKLGAECPMAATA